MLKTPKALRNPQHPIQYPSTDASETESTEVMKMLRETNPLMVGLAMTLLLVSSAACYHSIVDTGLEPGPTAYHEGWETAWLGGLVPAKVDARGMCGGPWARVETQQSFLNGLVSFLTLGIYAPHEVEIVCAAEVAEENSAR